VLLYLLMVNGGVSNWLEQAEAFLFKEWLVP
jgi:hypothetical protein